jgi:hypothetical protein
MRYTVTRTRRFRDIDARTVLGVSFSIHNASPAPHDFDTEGGGIELVDTAGQVVQIEAELSASDTGNPSCYTDPHRDPQSHDPGVVTITPNETWRFPKLFCVLMAPGERLAQVVFADNDVSDGSPVALTPPA